MSGVTMAATVNYQASAQVAKATDRRKNPAKDASCTTARSAPLVVCAAILAILSYLLVCAVVFSTIESGEETFCHDANVRSERQRAYRVSQF